jgi:hypothetical protein
LPVEAGLFGFLFGLEVSHVAVLADFGWLEVITLWLCLGWLILAVWSQRSGQFVWFEQASFVGAAP